jgi:hypothetical protein
MDDVRPWVQLFLRSNRTIQFPAHDFNHGNTISREPIFLTIAKKPPTGGVGGLFDGSIVDGLVGKMPTPR